MRDVGFELYQSMLEEAIAKIRSGQVEGIAETDEQWAPQINLGVPVLIPEDYVPDLDVRLGLYRRLSGLETKVEMEGFAAELIDRFGKLPREVNMLMLVVRIKAMCKRAGIAKLDGGPKGATIQFHNDKFASPQGLVEFIEAQRGWRSCATTSWWCAATGRPRRTASRENRPPITPAERPDFGYFCQEETGLQLTERACVAVGGRPGLACLRDLAEGIRHRA